MDDAALDTSLWEEKSAVPVPGATEQLPIDELSAAQGIFWWGLASMVLWAFVVLLIVATS